MTKCNKPAECYDELMTLTIPYVFRDIDISSDEYDAKNRRVTYL